MRCVVVEGVGPGPGRYGTYISQPSRAELLCKLKMSYATLWKIKPANDSHLTLL